MSNMCLSTSTSRPNCYVSCCCPVGEFTEEDALQRALQLVDEAGGIAAARRLAEQEGQMAREALKGLSDSEAKRSLELMVDYVLRRIH